MRGLFGSLRSVTQESDLVSNEKGWWSRLLGTGGEGSAAEINQGSALTLDTVWACVTAISEDVAKLPVHIYRRQTPFGRVRAPEHPAYRLLIQRPNDRMTAFVFRQTLQAHVLLWGNAYAEIERKGNGLPINLWPLRPERMEVLIKGGKLVYRYHLRSGGAKDLDPSQVFHIKGMGYDGIVGYSVIEFARRSLASPWSIREHGRRVFDNAAMISGVLSSPGTLTPQQKKNIEDSWNEKYVGPQNAGAIPILDHGLTFSPMSMPLKDAQWLEARQADVAMVCRWFRLPPHKAADLSRSAFSNIEQQEQSYLGDALMTHLVRWEQEANAKLLNEGEQDGMYFFHNTKALVRADMKTRYEANSAAVNAGWRVPDEVREDEEEGPLPNGWGQIPRFPTNMTTPAKILQPAEPAKQDAPANDGSTPEPSSPEEPASPSRSKVTPEFVRSLVQSLRPVFEQDIARVIRLESDKIRATRAKKADLRAWADEFYAGHLDFVREVVFPATEACANVVARCSGVDYSALDVAGLVRKVAELHVTRSRSQIREASLDAVEQILNAWKSVRAGEDAAEVLKAIEAWFETRLAEVKS